MNDINPDLLELYNEVATSDGGKNFTHMTLFDQRRWTVDNRSLARFWQQYCDLVIKDQNDANDIVEDDQNAVLITQLCAAEKPEAVMPVVAKISLRFEVSDPADDWEIYRDDFLQYLVLAYQVAIRDKFLLVSGNNLELLAAVMESETYWIETTGASTYRVMEIRIQFPYARIEVAMQRKILRQEVISKLRQWNVIGKLDRQPIGDWAQILSPDVLDRPLPLYGSVEVHGRPRTLLNYIYPMLTDEMIFDNQVPNYIDQVGECFLPINHNHVQQGLVAPETFHGRSITDWLPVFFSANYLNLILMPKADAPANQGTPSQVGIQNLNSPARFDREMGEENDQQIAERLILMLDPNRYFNESNWMDIGKALFNAHEGANSGYAAWIRHTKRAINGQSNLPLFMVQQGTLEETIKDQYSMLTNDQAINIKTLAWYACIDNPQTYASWHRDWCMVAMDKALSITHTDVAAAFYRNYWLTYSYSSAKGSNSRGTWYTFKNHRWMECRGGHDLRIRLKEDFVKKFETLRNVVGQQKLNSQDEDFRNRAEDAIQKIGALIKKLKHNGFKNSVVSELTDIYSDDLFAERLDANPDLLGLSNGVLESRDSILFRPTKPQDYVSMSTRVSYRAEFTWESPQVRKVMKYINEVYTNDEMRHHFLKFGASCLRGLNSDKIFPFFVGEGNNSKSMIVKLFENTFGQYCIKFDIANLSNNSQNASGASPQLARAKGVHIAFIDEPDDDAEIKKGTMKRWIGGDSFFTRMLYDAGGDLRVFFKLVLSCNKPPVVDNPDNASKNRIRLYPHISEWLKEGYPEDYNEQLRLGKFKMDPNFEDQIPGMAGAFLWVLVQYYPIYKNEGLNDPEAVTRFTNEYWQSNDIYAQFAAETIQPVINEQGQYDTNAQLTLTDIYEEFKQWFRSTFPGKNSIPGREIVKREFVSRWGRMHGNHWLGIRLVPKSNIGGGPLGINNRNNKQAPQAQPVLGGTGNNSNIHFHNQHSQPVQLNLTKPPPMAAAASPNYMSAAAFPISQSQHTNMPPFVMDPRQQRAERTTSPPSPHVVKPIVGIGVAKPPSPIGIGIYKGPSTPPFNDIGRGPSPLHNGAHITSHAPVLNPSDMIAQLNQVINIPLQQV